MQQRSYRLDYAYIIGLVIWLLGLSFWCGALWQQVENNTEQISRFQRIEIRLNSIDQRLSRIEGAKL